MPVFLGVGGGGRGTEVGPREGNRAGDPAWRQKRQSERQELQQFTGRQAKQG